MPTKSTQRIKQNLLKSMHSRHRFSRFLRILGPGLITGAADDDPSGIATYSQAGAMFGYGLLWAIPFMLPLLIAVQESCSRIGAVNGRGLASVIKMHYGKLMLYSAVSLVVVANVINIGADLGAMAASVRLFVPSASTIAIECGLALLIIGLVVFVKYKNYARVLKWLAVLLFAYPLTALIVGLSWSEIIRATFVPQIHLNFTTLFIIVGLLGTTISPYLFFWDTSEVVEEELESKRLSSLKAAPKLSKSFMRKLRIDNAVGMILAAVTAWFIMIVCSAVLNSHGITTINTAADAARAIEPLVKGFPHAGLIAKGIFSVGIIGLGLLAVPVLAGSSSYAISEAAGWNEGLGRTIKNAKGFYAIIILATVVGLGLNLLGIDPIKALVLAAVCNAVASVPLLFMITRIGKNPEIMGEHTNSRLSNTMIQLASWIMLIAVAILLVSLMKG